MSELTILESSPPEDLITFLTGDVEHRTLVIDRVILAGGLHDSKERFIEVTE